MPRIFLLGMGCSIWRQFRKRFHATLDFSLVDRTIGRLDQHSKATAWPRTKLVGIHSRHDSCLVVPFARSEHVENASKKRGSSNLPGYPSKWSSQTGRTKAHRRHQLMQSRQRLWIPSWFRSERLREGNRLRPLASVPNYRHGSSSWLTPNEHPRRPNGGKRA